MFVAEFDDDYRVLLDIPEDTSRIKIKPIIELYCQKHLRHKFTIDGKVTVNIIKIDDIVR